MATTSATTGTNIDVASIVSQLMTVEQRPLTALARKEASYQAKLSAVGTLQGALSNFQSAVSDMSGITKFQTMTAASSDSAVLSASAASTAAAGSYTIDVTSLAQSQKLVAAGQVSSTASIGTGAATTLTFDFGSIAGGTFDAGTGTYTGSTFTSNGNGTKTVTIDATNNSLQGIRDAINSANAGVTATIINDGSGTPYRLALSSNALGSTNSLKISVAGDATLGALLAQDPAATQSLSETATAQNANFMVNGVAVSKASNTVTDVIEGVTLTLQKTTTASASLTVARDAASIQSSVAAFVKAYNDLNKTLRDVSGYNADTKQGAILQGDSAVLAIQSQVRSVLNTPVSGGGTLTNLSQIGVSFQKGGMLALDTTKLSAAITSNPNDIAALFATVGKASDSLVSFSSAATTVKAGNYAVNITQLATQGKLAGSAAAGTLTIATGSNDALNVTVNGVSASVTLAAGTYTAATLAAEVQAKINGASALSGASVAVTQSGGVFTITSNSYGSTSSVSVSGTGASNLLGGAPVPTAGVDVAGTLDGQAATGSGQFLTSGSGNALGLKIQVTGGALGARGTVNYSHGYAYALDNLANSILASDGMIAGKTKGLNNSITDIGKQRDAVNVRLAALQKQYTAQFSALDVTLSSLNSTSNYLTQQLANLSYKY